MTTDVSGRQVCRIFLTSREGKKTTKTNVVVVAVVVNINNTVGTIRLEIVCSDNVVGSIFRYRTYQQSRVNNRSEGRCWQRRGDDHDMSRRRLPVKSFSF